MRRFRITGLSRGCRSIRSGFTLLEVMVAIVLTSIVALVAYGVAQVSADTRAHLDAGLRAVRSDRALRQTLLDLFHNARVPRQRGDTSFILEGDTLWFVAAGAAPLDPDYDWLVELHPGPAGLEVAARSLGTTPSARIGFRVPRVTRWEVRLLAQGDSQWQRRWSRTALLPRAVAISFWKDSVLLGPPLMVKFSDALPAGWVEDDSAAE